MSLEGVLGKVPIMGSSGSSSSMLVPAAATGAACIAGCIVGGFIMKKVSSGSSVTDKRPEKWIKVGQINDLLIYPVKGMPGTSLQEASLGRLGLKDIQNPHLRDRVFAVVNEAGKNLSLCKFPILALTKPVLNGDKLQLSYVKDPSMDIEIDVPTREDPSRQKSFVLYGEKVYGMDCGDKAAAWLNNLTGSSDLRLLYHVLDEPQRGVVKRNARFRTYRESHTGAFQDETSYMLMTDESVAAVNEHLEKPVSHTNFRPTIVVNGSPEPFSEDFWGFIRIGCEEESPVLKASLPCIRCNTTTIDPETGTFREDVEPLRTLNKLRRQVGDNHTSKLVAKSAIMGAHFGIFQGENSVIRVGDPVYAALL